MFIYGFAGKYELVGTNTLPVSYASQEIFVFYLIFASLFIICGFGNIFSYYRFATGTAFFIPIYTLATSIIASPIFSKFWFNVFITDFNGTTVNDGGPNRFHQSSFSGSDIEVDLYNLKVALANAISQLVVYLYIYGRVNILQVIIHSFVFNFLWNFNYFLCLDLQNEGPDERVLDDYMINFVYLFGTAYGLVLGLFTRKESS